MKMIALILIVLLSSPVYDIRTALKEDPTRASTNTRNYEFFPDSKMTPAPKGYKPFYISQYARHGARTDVGTSHSENLIKMLGKAEKKGILTAAGDTVLSEAKAFLKITEGHEGALIPSGQREHEQLAARLYQRYGEVFRRGVSSGKTVRVKSTTSHRAILSMAAFTNSLTSLVPEIRYSMSAAPIDMKLISNGPSDSIRTAANELRKKVLDLSYDRSYLMKRLFTDPGEAEKTIKPESLEKSLYYLARFSKPLDRDINLYRFLSEEAIYKYWQYTTIALYLLNCNSVEFGDACMKRCQSLVDIILDNAENAIRNGNVCADLFFGHDYPLLALAARFHIEGFSERLSADRIKSEWTDPTSISFASNIQMIFFRNKSDEILVKFIYNDRERKIIGLTPINGYYYRWEDIKNYR